MRAKIADVRDAQLELTDLRPGMRLKGNEHSGFYQVIITKTHRDYALGQTSVMGIPILLTEEQKPFIAVS